jgi:hypothetical protein
MQMRIIFWLLAFLCIYPSTVRAAAIQLPRTGQTASYGGGDDGAIQKGLAWPVPRFTANGDGTVSDNLTGLVWLQNANCFGAKTWTDALTSANTLASGACGLTDGSVAGDWRLPTVEQLASLTDLSRSNPPLPSGHPFSGVQTNWYWSSATFVSNPVNAWIEYFGDGSVSYTSKGGSYYVWPVWARQVWLLDSLAVSIKGSPYFGALPPGGTAVTREVTLRNQGAADLAVTSVAMTGANSTDFTVEPGGAFPCESLTPTIAAGDSCTVTVTFTPAYGAKRADLTVAANGKSISLPVSGTTAPPDTTITAKPATLSNSTDSSFSFTATTAGSTFECRLDSGSFAPCASPKSYSGLIDGSHTFSVRAIDPGASVDPTPASYGWTIDTTAPDTTIDNKPAALTSSTTANFAFFANDGTAGFECRLDGEAYAVCTTPKNYTGLADGSHTFAVRALDPAGNTDLTPASYSWTIDALAPPAASFPIQLPRTGQTASYGGGDDGAIQKGLAWPVPRFTANGDGTVSDNLTGLVWLQNANCFGAKTWTDALTSANTLASGACGLTDGSVAGDWRLPTVEQLASLTDLSRSNPPLPSGHPFSGVQTNWYWSSATFVSNPVNAWIEYFGDGSVSYTSKGGSYYVWPVWARQVWLLDSLAVSIKGSPYFGALPPGGTAVTREVTLRNQGAADLAVTSVAMTGANSTDFTVEPGGAFPCESLTPTIAAGDSCTVTVTFTPAYGAKRADLTVAANGKSISLPVSGTTAPPDTTITAKPATLSNSTDSSFSFTATTAGSTFECRLDSGSFAPCASPKSYSGLIDGSHTFSVRAIDPGASVDPTPASYGWTIDTTAPDTTIDNKPAALTSSTTANFAFFANDGTAGFECRLDGEAYAACTTPKNYTGLAEGSHTFVVRALDPAGNTDLTPASWSWTVDTTPPDTTIGSNPTSPTNNTSATFAFTATEANATFACRLDGESFAVCTTPKSYAGLTEGSHTFEVRATDLAGNIDPSPADFIWIIDTQSPVIASFTLPGTASSLSVPISSFTATDSVGVTGYLLAESATPPTPSDPGWRATPPADFNFATEGDKTLYAFARDGAGNISQPAAATVNISLPVNGSCGSSNGGTFITVPDSDLCASGIPTTVITGNGTWEWTCNGQNGGSNEPCSAHLPTYQLTVNAAGAGLGSVSSSTGGISYSYQENSSGSAILNHGTVVTLTAIAAAGSTASWSGNCSSTGGSVTAATCTISSMDGAKTVSATFALLPAGGLPYAYWTFDNDAANDTVGTNNGAIVGSGVTFTAGKAGRAISFGSGNSFVKIPGFNLPYLTVEAWVNPAKSGYYTSMVTKSAHADRWASPWQTWQLWLSENTANPGYNGTTGSVASPDAVPMNEWFHLAATYDGSTIKTYVNGVEKASQAVSTPAPLPETLGNIYIGAPEFSNHSFLGLIDEVAIWDHALSAEEIERHYQNGLAGQGYLSRTDTTITVAATPNPSTYGGSVTFTATVTSGATGKVSFAEGETTYCAEAAITGTTATCTVSSLGVGPHTITATYGGDESHNGSSGVLGGPLTVNKAVLTVIAANQTRLYGAANPVLTWNYAGFVNNDTVAVLTGGPAVAISANAASPVGTYPITLGQGTLAAENYDFVFVNGTLTVTKTPPTVTTFTVPATGSSLTVAVTAFTASDIVGVSGYLITESSAVPDPAAAGWSSNAPASYTFATPGIKTLYAWAKDSYGNVSAGKSADVTITIGPYFNLDVTFAGAGGGSVNSVPSGVNCTVGTCSASFNGVVNLIATPDWKSVFAGWSGDCNGSSPCSLTMDANKSVTASFSQNLQARMVGSSMTYHSTLQSAFDGATNGSYVQAKVFTFFEDILFKRAISVTLDGGKDAFWAATAAVTTIKGSLKIRSGALRVKKVVIR